MSRASAWELIKKANAQIAHISPTHHFDRNHDARTAAMSFWHNNEQRQISISIEDDYDSEFRRNGHPIPPILSIDVKRSSI